jgi:hypothetical protein
LSFKKKKKKKFLQFSPFPPKKLAVRSSLIVTI